SPAPNGPVLGAILYRAHVPASPLWPEVVRALAGLQGRASVSVYDAVTNRVYLFAPTEAFVCASIVKLQILGALLRRTGMGTGLSPGDRSLMTSMIEVSDNAAASTLWNQAGGAPGVGAFDHLAGTTATTPDPYGNW